MLYAFRCKNCGRLHTSDDAAEAEHPHACTVCGGGVVFNEKIQQLSRELADPKLTLERRLAIATEIAAAAKAVTKTIQPDNWDILHTMNPEQLKLHGLEPHHVEKHTPWPASQPGREPQHVVVDAQDSGTTILDKASRVE
jgi:hypothetical protein